VPKEKSKDIKAFPIASSKNKDIKKRFDETKGDEDLLPGYYLIANVFERKENFSKFSRILSDRGLEPRSFVRSSNGYTYVYLERYATEAEAIKARDSQFNGNYTDETWILRISDK
jgi:hypothetical protein